MENVKTELFTTENDGSNFSIAFDKYFGKEKLSVFNSFDLTSKRNFKMIANDIKETYETIFFGDEEDVKEDLQVTLLQILNLQSQIMKDQSMTTDEFIAKLKSVAECANNALLNEIDDYVETNYKLTLDADTAKMKAKNKSAVNEQLIISDEYGKCLIKIAYLDRIFIPLLSQFYIYNKGDFSTKMSVIQDEDDDSEDLMFSEVNQKIFNEIFKIVAKENTTNIQNKIHKMVYARLILTAAPSARYWNSAKNSGISIDSSALEIYSKLLSNSIPKIILSKDLNVVNFIAVIINNQITFLFSNKFKEHYQTINPGEVVSGVFESNDDTMTELERMEIQLGHKNEGSLIINNTIATTVINTIESSMEVYVSRNEIANMLQYVHMNPIQERIVAMMTFKYFKDTTTIKHLSAFDYAKLLLCCVKYLEKNKFVLLPKILMSNCTKQRDRTAITGVKVKAKIEEAKRYKELLDVKYADFKADVEKNIQSMIQTIYSSSFTDISGEDVFESSSKIGNIAEEIVDLCFLI